MRYQNEMEYPYDRSEGMEYSYADERATFIRRVYGHLAGAILAFIGLEFLLLQVVDADMIMKTFFATPFSWLIVLGAFMGAGWLAQSWAQSETSRGMQYLGLGLYVVAEAIIFLPILYIATNFFDDTLIPTAGILTLCVFGGLTLSVFVTKKDYSSLAPILSVGSMVALGVIVCAILFGFQLGLFFSFAMVALMAGYLLYETSVILHHHRTDQYVAAALALFASVATLFWYILRILMILNSRE